MLFYNVYYQTGETSSTIEFEATCGESLYGLNAGTKEWMEDALKSLKIKSEIIRWKVRPLRCAYVSQYFEYPLENWKDRWTECWNVKIWLEEKELEFENKLDEYPREGTDFIDTTFEENDICQENGMPACNDRVHIIADYRHSEGEKSAKSESLNEIIKKHWQGDFHIDKREFQYGICQNRIFLEKDEAFPRSLSTFDQILSDIKADGGVVNYQQRFPKFKVNFLEKPASKELSSDAPAHMVDFMKRLEEMRKEL